MTNNTSLLFFLSKTAVFTLLLLFLIGQDGITQESRPFRHTNEIGVDFAPFVRGQTGASLLYKYSFDKKASPEQKKRFAMRVLLGYYDYPYGYSSFVKNVGDTIFLREGSGRAKHQFIRVGTELQTRKRNFRFYLGADAGYRYWTSTSEGQQIALARGTRFIIGQSEDETKSNVVEASVMAGVNYFFLPRFSVGLEANVSLAMEFSRSVVTGNNAGVLTNYNTLLELDTRFLRLLYLSYHFGKQ